MIKLKTVLLLTGIVIVLNALIRIGSTIFRTKKDADSNNTLSNHLFLNKIDISKGKYAIIFISKTDSVPLLIDNQNLILTNMDKVLVRKNWKSNLPSYTKSYGLLLFKDGKLIKEEIGKNFEKFDLGTLLNDTKPLKKIEMHLDKKQYLKRYTDLVNKHSVFIVKSTELMADEFEYSFNVKLPTVVFPNSDTVFNKKDFSQQIERQIKEGLKNMEGYKLKEITDIAWKTKINNSEIEDYNTYKDSKKSISCYDFILNFDCTTAFYEQIKNHDFSKNIPKTDSNLKLLAKTEQTNNNVINSNEKPIISKLEKRKFEIVYYELKQD